MSKNKILLGYEVGTGDRVDISPSHLIVTGVSQLSGKTTTLEALIKRSGLKAVVFKTKIGEKSFSEGTETPPFFRDRSDYEFVRSLIEAYAKEKLFLEKGTLMRLCKGSGSLLEIKKRVDDTLVEGKLRGLKEEIYTRLQHYLENLIPQIQFANLSKVLDLSDGINIMNLERFSEEAQSLVIQSVADEVLKTMKCVVLVIPETWKFLPQKYNNPCKRVVERFIREGAANRNFVFLDSQDMAGVDKIPLKQVSTWILGLQTEKNEVKHTLDQIPLPTKMKPNPNDIMTLKKGHFYLSSYNGVKKVYVLPLWLSDKDGIRIAKGELDTESVEQPKSLTLLSIPQKPSVGVPVASSYDDRKIRRDLVELRTDFFNKIEEQSTAIRNIFSEIYALKSSNQEMDEDELVSKVLQKVNTNGASVDKEEIIREVVSRIPKSSGSVTYEVSPLEKIKKDFMEEAKNKIIGDILGLSEEQKKILKFVESQGKGCNQSHILAKSLHLSATSGGARKRVSAGCREMSSLGVVRMDKNLLVYPNLKDRIKELMGIHSASKEEMETVYNHVLAEMI